MAVDIKALTVRCHISAANRGAVEGAKGVSMTRPIDAEARARMTPELMQLEATDGSVLPYELPGPSSKLGPSVFSFALHKSGSVLLDNIILELCGAAAVPAFSIDGICFRAGMRLQNVRPESAQALLSRPGYCFYGFRGLHGFMRRMNLSSNRKIILVRDPRDILTSYFFSMKFSHTVPPAGDTRANVLAQREAASSQSIDDYVLSPNVAFIRKNFHAYIGLEGPATKVYKYEDIIFDKKRWVAEINEWFGFGVTPRTAAAIAARHDIFPEQEDPHAHIRQVAPGNYKKHLAPSTVEQIESQYRDLMMHYRYM
jgi:hypothetical protein